MDKIKSLDTMKLPSDKALLYAKAIGSGCGAGHGGGEQMQDQGEAGGDGADGVPDSKQ